MKPWMLSAMVALPACELARKAGGAPVLDVKLAEDAKAAGKTLEGLETVADQLRAMASLPMDFHMQGPVDTLKLGDRIDDVIETMIVLYDAATPACSGRCSAPCCLTQRGRRGRLCRVRGDDDHQPQQGHGRACRPILAKGNAFIAVGALASSRPEGLIEIVRQSRLYGHRRQLIVAHTVVIFRNARPCSAVFLAGAVKSGSTICALTSVLSDISQSTGRTLSWSASTPNADNDAVRIRPAQRRSRTAATVAVAPG